MNMGNLFAAIPDSLPDELFEELMAEKGIKIERIVSKGQASPDGFWYDQPENEWVLVVRGAARLRIEGVDEPIELTAGTYINLPAHVKHRVDWTKEDEETIWLAIFY
ncbi:cupin domain-containing protein [Larkinella humicola]|uniref:Cupin domain-containing protein n=1 Tax=Larkinella humicola TaxID=2607654 RepID=A0A5N1JK24_9BACT|nr:cupin domain-containing protein [Larkinella humicola]KAA9356451.1 cupin domain-containing protein [Larkinella humicola]